MPEILEAEQARRLLEATAPGREVGRVHAPDAWFLKRGLTPTGARRALRGQTLREARRRGKLLLVETTGPVLGLHLGMSGRLVIDGAEAGDPLVYASDRAVPAWHRFGLTFTDGGTLWLRDPRRLGSVELDPDEDRLGPDAFDLDGRALRGILAASRAPLKARLIDQARLAGLGNLLVDEALWRAGLDPRRPAGALDAAQRARLLRAIRTTLRVLGRRGGSHTGDLPRQVGEACPADGVPLRRATVGGRTTYWCPDHQR